ncbi:MAG: hypothetical protein NTU73_14245 [Ignavibacteriae bacterium]|nr:hypothetical protein [Ignavibacteriota bacterium]
MFKLFCVSCGWNQFFPWDWNQIFPNIIGNFLGDLLIISLIWLLSDYIFKLPNLNGKWRFTINIKDTKFSTYKDLNIIYDVYIYQIGNQIYGTGEKIKDIDVNGKSREYIGKDRARIDINGTPKKYLWKNNEAIIHIKEENEVRASTSIHLLKIYKNNMKGYFYSSIADQSGNVEWERISR